jgi:TRAP-type C4-dicarboxylate transport system permease small subunit
MTFQVSLFLGLVFGLLAAILAFVIVYEAGLRQQFSSSRIWHESVVAAAFAFTVFLLSTIALGYALRVILS